MIDAVHVVWITAGLGCDGDTIAMTAASLPSIEELVAGALPGVPRVILHNPVLAYENGAEFLGYWHRAAAGQLDPFLLVVEGSIPDETNKSEGYWAAFGTDPATGQPRHRDRCAERALGSWTSLPTRQSACRRRASDSWTGGSVTQFTFLG